MKLIQKLKTFWSVASNSHVKSFLSVVSAMINLLAYLLIMRLVYMTYGLDVVGFWSLLMAVSSVVRLLDFSGCGTLNRMLPVDAKSHDVQVKYVDTMAIFVLIFYIFISFFVYVLGATYLQGQGDLANVQNVPIIFQMCLLAAGLHVMSAVHQLALDGLGHAQLRSYVVVIASFCFLFLAAWLVPYFGLLGLAVAQACQHIVGIILGRRMLRKLNEQFSWFPRFFQKKVFSRCFEYGLFFEMVNRPKLVLDPMVRLLVGHTVGLEALGLYDLASKIVLHTNSLVQAMLSPKIPEFAISWSNSPSLARDMFLRATSVYIPVLICIHLAVWGATFGISAFVFDEIVPKYILISSVLLLGYGLASPSLISQIYAQSRADFRWSLAGQIITVAAIPFALYPTPVDLNVEKVAVIVSCSIFVGSLVEYLGIHFRLEVPMFWSDAKNRLSVLSITAFCAILLIFIIYFSVP